MSDVCFAYNYGMCAILDEIPSVEVCGKCAFFKTKRQYAKDRLKYFDKECEHSHVKGEHYDRRYDRLLNMANEI